MNQLDKQLQTKLLYISNQYFSSNGNIDFIKIADEPYTYKISRTKMYVFNENELLDFLMWYWFNEQESFIFDSINIDYKKHWKYFSDNNPGFRNLYPDADTFNSNVIEQPNAFNTYNNLININGINHFINHVIIDKYKLMDIKKNKNVYYKFAKNH